MAPSVEHLVKKWWLRELTPLEGGLLAQVYGCRDARGRDLVLKVIPRAALEHAASAEVEAAALDAWSGPHVPELISVDLDAGALLMARVLPGTDLSVAGDSEAVELVAPVLRSLHFPPPPHQGPFGSLAEAVSVHLRRRRVQAENEVPELLDLVDVAAVAAHRLAEAAGERVLLHGDLMDKNLLVDGVGRAVAIDPMPRVGDPHADIGYWAAARRPVATITRRVERMSMLLGRDPDRATRWAVVWAVSGACESWRADVRELRRWARTNERALMG